MLKKLHIFILILGCFHSQVAAETQKVPNQKQLHLAEVYGLNEIQITNLYQQFSELVKAQGFSEAVVKKAQNLDVLSLIRVLQITEQSSRADLDFVRRSISYWRGILGEAAGIDQLEHFFAKTKHSNPFHILNIDFKNWDSFLNMMIKWEIFTSVKGEEARSFRNFVIQYKWMEGAQTSKKRDAEFWNRWSEVFESTEMKPRYLGEAVYDKVFKTGGKHSDGIQSLYLALSPDLLQVLLKYPQYLNAKLMGRVFASNLLQVSMMSYDIQQIFERYKAFDVNPKSQADDVLRDIEYLLQRSLVDKIEARKSRGGKGKACHRFI